MKYETGTITVTVGSNVVAGTGTDWSSLDDFWLIDPTIPKQLTITALGLSYRILAITADGSLKIAKPIPALPGAVASASGLEYYITADFTPWLEIPLPRQGDMDKGGLLKRGLEKIDDALDALL